MGMIRTLGATTVVSGTPTPAVLAAAFYTNSGLAVPGVVIAAVSFVIKNKIATITLGSLPTIGYNGPNGYIPIAVPSAASATQSQNIVSNLPVNIQGNFPAPNGQQVVLWGFSTATYFNGKKVSVIGNDPSTKSFSFYFNHADVSVTSDTGNTAPIPAERYRAIRLEAGQGNGTDLVYVGDLNVSYTQYMAALSLTGQLSIEIASENIPPEGLFIDGTSGSDTVQVSVIY
jgi:hypothetical protein